jgi:uncharacterized protein with ParB-like and HNH nuclease domain
MNDEYSEPSKKLSFVNFATSLSARASAFAKAEKRGASQMSIVDDIDKHRNDIVTDTYTVTWRELLGQYKDGELIIDPEYQRLFRWDLDQQTQYIESILLNIPSPPLFLARNKDGIFEVIDGLQRVSTLLKFFAGEVFGDESDDQKDQTEPEQTQNDIRTPTKLADGPILSSLEDFTATTLPETLIRTIKYARITIILLEKESSHRARYEVFRRLNKLGSPLSDQEIRNCTARLLGKEFPAQLRTLAEKKSIRAALSLTEEAVLRMGVEEMLLRLLAFNYSEKRLKHQITEYLDDFMAYAAEGKFKLTEKKEQRIENTFNLIQKVSPDGKAFRFPRSGFSTNLFDVIATGVFHNLDELNASSLRVRLGTLMKSSKLRDLTGAGSNTRKKLEGRINLGKAWFRN